MNERTESITSYETQLRSRRIKEGIRMSKLRKGITNQNNSKIK